MVWLVASRENDDTVRRFADQLGLTLPVLLDRDGSVQALYDLPQAFPTAAYPEHWLVGADGRIAWFANELEHDALTAAIEAALAP